MAETICSNPSTAEIFSGLKSQSLISGSWKYWLKRGISLTKSISNKADKTYVDGGHASLLKKFDKWHEGKVKTVAELNKKIAKNDKGVTINAKGIEVLSAKIEEIKEKDANPLLD